MSTKITIRNFSAFIGDSVYKSVCIVIVLRDIWELISEGNLNTLKMIRGLINPKYLEKPRNSELIVATQRTMILTKKNLMFFLEEIIPE